LKPAAGRVNFRRDGFPASGTARFSAVRGFSSAGQQKCQRDDNFNQQGGEKLSRANGGGSFGDLLIPLTGCQNLSGVLKQTFDYQ